jgi:ribA/ribD-fused uncharacterized protein
LSPTFGQFRYDVEAVEPGLDLESPLGRFRNNIIFKRARINLLKAFEESKRVSGLLDLSGRGFDRNYASIAMMGPAFLSFLVAVKEVKDWLYDSLTLERELAGEGPMPAAEWAPINNSLARPELDLLIEFLVTRVGEDAETSALMLQDLYSAVGTPEAVQKAAEFGRVAAQRSRMNQEEREEDRIERQRAYRDQARERQAFWREWRRKKAEQEASGGPSAGTAESYQVAGLMGGPAPAPQQPSTPPPAKIDHFRNEYFFLSNMSDSPITLADGLTYPRVENAFHALKTSTLEGRRQFVDISGKAAKALGRKVPLDVQQWNAARVGFMHALLQAKFSIPPLRQALLATGNAVLEEGHVGDKFWGTVDGKGENMLGKLLMQVRDEIRSTRTNGGRRR